MIRRLLLLLTLLLCLAACEQRVVETVPIPTPADINALVTALPLTQNAPPPPYNVSISFPQIDDHLTDLSGWRYTVRLEFDGVFARTSRPAQATASAQVEFNQLSSARRVIVETSGELIGQTENTAYEAARLGPDSFLVRDDECQNNTDAARLAADLRAGNLIGGVAAAVPAGQRGTINGTEVYRYTFNDADLVLPTIRVGDGGSVVVTSGELWFSAAHNAVVRFWVNVQVANAFIFDRQLPVDGTIVIRYDLYDIGTAYNINVPFGC
ncbi:MAG: hypothetical protein SF123_17320 [Chloroflexota bacterium]|nr:hypothetical protein [Chloroflexota bacterium]